MGTPSRPTVKGYELLFEVGSDGYSTVFCAYQRAMERKVSLKIFPTQIANQTDFIRHFERDTQRIARLEHLHLVPMYDYWRDTTGAFLVTRWMQGGNLWHRVVRRALTLPEAIRMLEQVASALAAAHDRELVHGSVRPNNILFDEDGNAFLADFAIGRLGCTQSLRGGDAIQRLVYLAPDQQKGSPPNAAGDIYGLALTFYTALTGKPPFTATSREELLHKKKHGGLESIDSLSDDVAHPIHDLFRRATLTASEATFVSATTLAVAFRDAAGLRADVLDSALIQSLTWREQEILNLISAGHTNREIAQTLCIEHATVKWHVTQLYRKLDVRSRVQAIAKARELDLIVPTAKQTQAQSATHDDARAAPVTALVTNPFKGLRPFTPGDSPDFFGREASVEKILARMQAADPLARFLLLVGPSGSGKSSLINAGIIPHLWSGVLPGSARWLIVRMTPGSDPLAELEVALHQVYSGELRDLQRHLSLDANGLLRAARLLLPPAEGEIILIVDQLEELFTLASDEQTHRDFVDLLRAASSTPDSRVRVLAALRADFFDQALRYPTLGRMLNGHTEFMAPLTPEEMEAAIRSPVARYGITFQPGLVSRIVHDLQSSHMVLPLLQYALTELFERREGNILTLAAYEDMGGAGGALAATAETLFKELAAEQQDVAKQMFLRLVRFQEPGDGTVPTPPAVGKVQRAELRSLTTCAAQMDDVIDTYTAQRLLILDHDPRSRQPTVQLAHEALLRAWGRFSDWVDEYQQDLRVQQWIRRAATEWVQAGRDVSFQLRGARLDSLAAWAEETELVLTPEESDFLATSLAHDAARVAERLERERREVEIAQRLAESERTKALQQKRSNRRLRVLVGLLAIFLVVAVSTTFSAMKERADASRQARTAHIRELGAAALSNLNVDPDLSILLALEAAILSQEVDGKVPGPVEEALHRSIQNTRLRLTVEGGGGVAFLPDGTLVSGGDGRVFLWDIARGRLLESIPIFEETVGNIAVSPDGRFVAAAIAGEDHIVGIWDRRLKRKVAELPAHDRLEEGRILRFSQDGHILLIGSQYGTAFWNTENWRSQGGITLGNGIGSDFQPDAHIVAVCHDPQTLSFQDDGPLALTSCETWDVDCAWQIGGCGQENVPYRLLRFSGHAAAPNGVAFSPDGRLLASASDDQTIRLWDVSSGQEHNVLRGHAASVTRVAFSSDGLRLASAGEDGAIHVWDVATGRSQMTLNGHRGRVWHVAFSPDGSRLASAAEDGTTRVWDVTAGGQRDWLRLYGQEGPIDCSMSEDSKRLISVDESDSAIIWAIPSGEQLATLQIPGTILTSVAFAPDPSLLALGSAQERIYLYNLEGQRVQRELRSPAGRALSVDFSPDGHWLAAGMENGRVILYRIDGGWTQTWDPVLITSAVRDVEFSPDSKQLAGAGRGVVSLLDVKVGRDRLQLLEHSVEVDQVAFSSDGEWLATTDRDGNARLWDVDTGELLRAFRGHRGPVTAVAVSIDRRRLATGGPDGRVLIWDTQTGELLLTIGEVGAVVRNLQYSTDGRFLAAAGSDGEIDLFIADVGELIQVAQTRVTRLPTAAECERYLLRNVCPSSTQEG